MLLKGKDNLSSGQERYVDKLKTYVKSVVRVIRVGKEIQMDAQYLVPGDIVLASEGDRVPAEADFLYRRRLWRQLQGCRAAAVRNTG